MSHFHTASHVYVHAGANLRSDRDGYAYARTANRYAHAGSGGYAVLDYRCGPGRPR
jgi:hypothetical protein